MFKNNPNQTTFWKKIIFVLGFLVLWIPPVFSQDEEEDRMGDVGLGKNGKAIFLTLHLYEKGPPKGYLSIGDGYYLIKAEEKKSVQINTRVFQYILPILDGENSAVCLNLMLQAVGEVNLSQGMERRYLRDVGTRFYFGLGKQVNNYVLTVYQVLDFSTDTNFNEFKELQKKGFIKNGTGYYAIGYQRKAEVAIPMMGSFQISGEVVTSIPLLGKRSLLSGNLKASSGLYGPIFIQFSTFFDRTSTKVQGKKYERGINSAFLINLGFDL